jgi:UPF0716 protein FxsA
MKLVPEYLKIATAYYTNPPAEAVALAGSPADVRLELPGLSPNTAAMPWIFILLPWIELWTLIELGSEIGGLAAILYVFATLVLGLSLLRRQGLAMARKMQQEYGGRFLGPQLLMDDMAIVSCGLLLMVPGLITDFLGLLCLVGPLRRRLLGLISGNSDVHRNGMGDSHSDPHAGGQQHPKSSDTLEGEFRRLDD